MRSSPAYFGADELGNAPDRRELIERHPIAPRNSTRSSPPGTIRMIEPFRAACRMAAKGRG